MTKREFIESYISLLEDGIAQLDCTISSENYLLECINEVKDVFTSEAPEIKDAIQLRMETVERDANVIIGILKLHILNNEQVIKEPKDEPIIFLSHKSDDKKYADALEQFITGLGVNKNQLIYTSHPLHKIPMDSNIYDYLRTRINSNVFMIFLWSDKYLESPACMNEMGAAWVVQSDYTNFYVPTFSFDNPKYRECAVDTRKMGVILNGDEHCKASMIEFKNKIQNIFHLENDEQIVQFLLDKFVKEIKGIK